MDLIRPTEEVPVSPMVALQSYFSIAVSDPREGTCRNVRNQLSDQDIHIDVRDTDWGQPSVYSVSRESGGREQPVPASQLHTAADKPEAQGCHLMSLWFSPRRLMR